MLIFCPSIQMAPAPSEGRVRSLIPWRRAADAMVEAELRNRIALAEEQLQTSRPRLMTCGHSKTLGRRWRRPAYDRRHLGRAGGHGFEVKQEWTPCNLSCRISSHSQQPKPSNRKRNTSVAGGRFPAHNQSQASAFAITDAVIENANDWRDASDGRHGGMDNVLLLQRISSSVTIS
jgi:hypothetical protein